MFPRLVTCNTYKRSFRYKILNNVLFLNKKFLILGTKSSLLYSFCNLYDKTLFHMFYECDRINCLWLDLVRYFQNNLILQTLTPQNAIFGIFYSASIDSFFKSNNVSIKYITLVYAKQIFDIETGKLHMINHSVKWGGCFFLSLLACFFFVLLCVFCIFSFFCFVLFYFYYFLSI